MGWHSDRLECFLIGFRQHHAGPRARPRRLPRRPLQLELSSAGLSGQFSRAFCSNQHRCGQRALENWPALGGDSDRERAPRWEGLAHEVPGPEELRAACALPLPVPCQMLRSCTICHPVIPNSCLSHLPKSLPAGVSLDGLDPEPSREPGTE